VNKPYAHIPEGAFQVDIEPLTKDGCFIRATVQPIIVTLEGGGESIQLITGYEILSGKKSGACHISELDWLIESGQYKVV